MRTARELFDMMNAAQGQAFQRLNQQFGWPGAGSPPGGNSAGDDDDYDHYNVEGSDPRFRAGNRNRRSRGDSGFDLGDNPLDDLGGAVLGAALGFAGRAIGRRMKKAFDERVVPAMETRAAQAQQQFEQQRAEQDAIVTRYPELRACTRDQVVFLDGGSRTFPVKDIVMPVTVAQADAVVARLR